MTSSETARPSKLLFASRGSVAVRAALTHQQENKLPPSTISVRRERKKPKAMVLFTEPLVTNQFEYEQTVIDIDSVRTKGDDDETNEDNIGKKYDVAKRSHPNRKPKQVRLLKCNRLSTSFEQDNGEKLATLDELPPKKSSNKRPLNDEDKQFYDSSDGSESLFSSPKIAKIVPYFHNQHDYIISENTQSSEQFNPTRKSQLDSVDVSSQETSYMGWFTNGYLSVASFLSNQMNKLIS